MHFRSSVGDPHVLQRCSVPHYLYLTGVYTTQTKLDQVDFHQDNMTDVLIDNLMEMGCSEVNCE